MIWQGTDRRTVFILGAGATRGALLHVLINGKRIQAPLNGDFFKVAERFVTATQGDGFRTRYQRIRNVFKHEFPTRGRWPITMEEAFSLLYVSKDFPEIYGSRRGRRRRAGSRKEIEDFLRLTFGILTAIESKASAKTLYDRLVCRLGPNDALVTVNYDTLLDYALVRAGWNPAVGYGLSGGANKIKWRMPKPPQSMHLSHVKLLKLHGSLNWYVRGSFDHLARVFDAKPTKVLITSRPRTNENKGFIRQIVPPIYGKFFGHSHWRDLWAKAYEQLSEADVLVVIGCSLVDTDFHLVGMLSKVVIGRKKAKRPFRAVIIVNGTKVRRKWLRLLRGCVVARREYPRFLHFAKALLK